jgi:hypothetical protein
MAALAIMWLCLTDSETVLFLRGIYSLAPVESEVGPGFFLADILMSIAIMLFASIGVIATVSAMLGKYMPKLLVSDVHSNLGGIREMINDYIENVKGGQITPACDNNWSLVGINWDQELHRRAAELVADGKLALKLNNRKLPIASLTEQDVRGATA